MVSGADSWHHLLINKRDVGDPVLVLTAKVIVRMYMCNTLRKELKHWQKCYVDDDDNVLNSVCVCMRACMRAWEWVMDWVMREWASVCVCVCVCVSVQTIACVLHGPSSQRHHRSSHSSVCCRKPSAGWVDGSAALGPVARLAPIQHHAQRIPGDGGGLRPGAPGLQPLLPHPGQQAQIGPCISQSHVAFTVGCQFC